jgi:3-phosphoshikimate 1-carboxyvinyltransferase
MSTVWVGPSRRPLVGSQHFPGDKSIAHRAVLLGALAEGVQEIVGLPRGADVRTSLAAVASLGARVEEHDDVVRVRGAGRTFAASGPPVVDCANSGTTMRLLAGMLAGGSRPVTLDGDASLRRRPMERVAAPLRAMGAKIETTGGLPPMHIEPGALRGVEWTMPVASAQVKSAILLAALRARGETMIHEPLATRDHTERMLGAMGIDVRKTGDGVAVRGGQSLTATRVELPGDPSSAAFFAVAATVVPGSRLVLRDVCVNPTRNAFVAVLRRMGARVEQCGTHERCGEPRADLEVHASRLRATEITADEVPGVIDELPILAVAAACADGETRLSGAAELRAKESDRLEALGQLRELGVDVTILPDGWVIRGAGETALRSARVSARGDHRIAMAFAVAALRAPGGIEIEDAAAADVSFPEFFGWLAALGPLVERRP